VAAGSGAPRSSPTSTPPSRRRGNSITRLTVCEEIGRWGAALSFEEIPERVVERARLQTAAMLAAREAGLDAAAPVAAAAPDGPVGEVYANAAASIAHDWDDYLYMGHTGHSAVWAARAFADDRERALVAQIAGNEVAGRLGAALFLGPHNGQFWSSIHCAGGAVAAGVALGLDAERLAHALAIALYQPPYGIWPGFMGPSSKLLTAAEPAAQGARAALMAAEGLEGALDVIENPRGLLTHFSFAPRPSMLGALGRVWLTDTLAFKPLPGCAYLQSVLDAVLAADVAPGDVASVEVEAGQMTCAMERLGRGSELTPVRVNFSVALSIAVALLAGRFTHEELRRQWLTEHEAEVLELASRVSVRHDWDLTLETIRGPLEAGATLGDVPLAGWRRVRRRMRELGMDEVTLGWDAVRELAGSREARRTLASALRRPAPGGAGIERLDTAAMRLSFPSRLRVRLRSGREIALEGREPGSCGRPLSEQQAVVERKCRLVGVEEGAWLAAK
jgi:2-methylcitrate dehydratase PrpD